MDVRGYGTGPITADAAFTSDFAIPDDIPVQNPVDMVEIERRSMDVRPGMRHKCMPLRFDPASGARQVGGRYLFDTWDDAVGYNTFTSKQLEFEPGVKFWDRPFFLGIDRHIWRVAGAYDFAPLATHYVSRFERWTYTGGTAERLLQPLWPTLRENAGWQRLASVWLLFQPEEEQIGILTLTAKADGADPADVATRSVTGLERTESVGQFLPAELGAQKVRSHEPDPEHVAAEVAAGWRCPVRVSCCPGSPGPAGGWARCLRALSSSPPRPPAGGARLIAPGLSLSVVRERSSR